jgi:hypothetical protein
VVADQRGVPLARVGGGRPSLIASATFRLEFPPHRLRSSQMHDRRELWGWLLFLVCAVLFVVASIRDRDLLIGVASVVFLVACVLFLVAYPKR